jgi:hypothetical protein
VYVAREGREGRKTFEKESEAKAWRAEATTAAKAGKLRTASRLSVAEAAWLWLEAAHTGAVRDRGGSAYKPGTLREYERSLRSESCRSSEPSDSLRCAGPTSRRSRTSCSPPASHRAPSPTSSIPCRRSTGTPYGVSWSLSTRPTIWSFRRPTGSATGLHRRLRLRNCWQHFRPKTGHCGRPRSIPACVVASYRRCAGSTLTSAVPRFGSHVHGMKGRGRLTPSRKAGMRTVPILAVLRDYLDALKIDSGRDGDDLVFGRTGSEPFPSATASYHGRSRRPSSSRSPFMSVATPSPRC